MRVVHLSTQDIKGGAARAAHRLHRGLEGTGVKSTMFVRKKRSAEDRVKQLHPDDSLSKKCKRAFRYTQIRKDYFPRYVSQPWSTGDLMNDDRSRFAGEVVDQLPPADILHLHWVAGFVDIPAFFEKTDVPIVWTLHDMNPITGGCHYSFGCRRFEQSCGCCPQIDSTAEEDPSRRSWRRKRAVFREKIQEDQLHVIAPSKWLTHEAKQSTLLQGASIDCSPYGLDHTLFRPRSAKEERAKLNIPESRKVVLFVAYTSTNPRKGLQLLVKALRQAQLKDVTLVSIGSNRPEIPRGFSHVHVGHVDSDQQLSLLYSMSDVFVIPSLQDNLPNTVLESMACGTPVVGFDAGGIPDMVRPGETGWLAETKSIYQLSRAIKTALENKAERERMGKRCRQVVEKEYTLERQAQRYKKFYSSILGGAAATNGGGDP